MSDCQGKAACERILLEHRDIRVALGKLEHAPDACALREVLAPLLPALQAHFSHEESTDGLHACIEETAPRQLHRVGQLLGEHRALLAAVAHLVERAQLSASPAVPYDRLHREVVEFVLRLRSHEESENELFHETLFTDIGCSE